MKNLYSKSAGYLPALSLLLLCFTSSAQTKINGSIYGQLVESNLKEPIEYGVASLLNPADSTVLDNAMTGKNGFFSLNNLKAGNYLLKISYLGYKTIRKAVTLTTQKSKIDLGILEMEVNPIVMNTVAVTAEKPPVVLKQDTIEFNAGSFKTRENAMTEDLLKKLPGVEVDKEGNIKAQGETVRKVYVDGREFFGNDPKIATRNLPANIIDKVQVIDKKSDQAEFTKIDDGQREKVINLTIKEDKKIGYFGNAMLGGGNDEIAASGDNRFDGNLNMNRFNGDQQISLVSNGNNTNKSNFSLQDLADLSGNSMLGSMGGSSGGGVTRLVIGGGSMGGGLGGGSSLDNLAPSSGGINTTGSGGLNFKDKWGKNVDINGSYFYNYSKAENQVASNRINLLAAGNSYYNSNSDINNERQNHRINLTLDYKINDRNSLRVTPSFSYNLNDQNQGSTFASLSNSLSKINDGSRSNNTVFHTPAFNNNLLYRHSFAKRGRTFSLNLASSMNSSATEAYNNTITTYYSPGNPIERVNQFIDQDSRVNNQSLRLSYTEPIMRDRYLELNYSLTDNYSKANRETYNFNTTSNEYDVIDPAFSNIYNNTFFANQYGLNFRTAKKKMNYTVGLSFQQTNLKGEATNLPSAIDKNYYSWLPNANLNYQFSQNRRFAATYRASVRQPSISQLQPVPDNSNPLNIRNGNPNLKPEYNNLLSLNYSNFTLSTNRSIFLSAYLMHNENSFATKTDLDPATGKRVSTPVNVNGNRNANANLSLGLPIPGLKTSVNLNTGVSTRRNVNFSNNDENITNTWSFSQGLSWNYAYKESFDFSINTTITYNRTGYSLATLTDLNYFDFTAGTDFNYNFPMGMKAGFDIDFIRNTGRGNGYNREITLVNSNIQKDVLNKKATIKFQVNDLFNKNLNVSRNVTENSIDDTRSNNLRRYFLMSFTYRVNKFGGKA